MEIQHESVMPEEVMSYLAPEHTDGLVIDCTLGEGGHSERFLKSFPHIQLVGIDADAEIMAKARQRLEPYTARVSYHQQYFDEFFQEYPLEQKAHRILFDLGISVFHYSESGRGFSFAKNEQPDMRINPQRGKPVSQLLREISEEELVKVLFEYGEERYSRRIARAIIHARNGDALDSSVSLAELIRSAVPASYRHGRIHPATRSFQAFRILVNRELDRIEPAVREAFSHLEIGGRIGVISFHSLEDRIVKRVSRELAKSCICPPELPMCECGGKPLAKLPVRRAIQPGEEEVARNSPSRSAKFRVIEKLRDSRQD